MRGGLAIGAGLIAGNLIGFFRVAVTAYLLGTHSAADALAVAIGPIDTLNSVLTNTMIFAFVPLLTEHDGAARAALFRKLTRVFTPLIALLALSIILFAPWMIRVLAPVSIRTTGAQRLESYELAGLLFQPPARPRCTRRFCSRIGGLHQRHLTRRASTCSPSPARWVCGE